MKVELKVCVVYCSKSIDMAVRKRFLCSSPFHQIYDVPRFSCF